MKQKCLEALLSSIIIEMPKAPEIKLPEIPKIHQLFYMSFDCVIALASAYLAIKYFKEKNKKRGKIYSALSALALGGSIYWLKKYFS